MKRVHRWSTGFLDGQDGFFEASLHMGCRGKRKTLQEAEALPPSKAGFYDAVIVNAKSGLDPFDPEAFQTLRRKFTCPVSLFLGAAQPEVMPPDAVVDQMHYVFKREPFRDLARYTLSHQNRRKILPTHLSCPLAPTWRRWTSRNAAFPCVPLACETNQTHDVFFIGGSAENRFTERERAWSTIVKSNVDAVGGLFSIDGYPVPQDLRTEKVPKPEFKRLLMASRINLALDGIGPFTYRHLEVFWAGAFCLSNASIDVLKLRAPLLEGRDYVSFTDTTDMMHKIHWYLSHDDARNTIARNGRQAFERLYDVRAHAQEIAHALGDA